MPALPLDEAGKYVAGAYVVFLTVLVIYVSIMAVRLRRVEAQLREAMRQQREQVDDGGATGRPAAGERSGRQHV